MIKIESVSDKIKIIRISNPKKKNALELDFFTNLYNIIVELENDNKIRACIICGEGGNFSVGLNLIDASKLFLNLIQQPSGDHRHELFIKIKELQKSIIKIYKSKIVFIASINGYCIGAGLDIISACDIRISSLNAIYSLKETKLGIVADLGSLCFLPEIIGIGNTKLMALTGANYTAQKCYEMNLIQEIVSEENLMKVSVDYANRISENPLFAVRGTKDLLNSINTIDIERSLTQSALLNCSFIDNDEFKEVMINAMNNMN